MDVIDQALFRVTRDTDYDVAERLDDLYDAFDQVCPVEYPRYKKTKRVLNGINTLSGLPYTRRVHR